MGGNTYNRKYYTDEQLNELANWCKEHPLQHLSKDFVFDTDLQWRANVSRHLDINSIRRFYFLLAGKVLCPGCNTELSINSFDTRGQSHKYCPKCEKSRIWVTNESAEARAKRSASIQKSSEGFWQTDRGIAAAKSISEKNSVNTKRYNQTEQGKARIERSKERNRKIMNERILSGEFTPNSNNRNTHWDAEFNGKKYRSSWEAVYQAFFLDDLHEQLRVNYEFQGKNHIYIVDFINHSSKIVTEVKPRELCHDEKTQAKIAAAKVWCEQHGYKFQIADQEFLSSLPMTNELLQQFDLNSQRKVMKLYEHLKN